MDGSGHRPHKAHIHGKEHTHGILAGGADIEQSHLEGKADGQTRHQDRRCKVEHIAESGKSAEQHPSKPCQGVAREGDNHYNKTKNQTQGDCQKCRRKGGEAFGFGDAFKRKLIR